MRMCCRIFSRFVKHNIITVLFILSFTDADLADWLENDADRHCTVEERGDRKHLVKVPYDDDFDFLYYQRVCNGNNLSRNQAFYYCGFYNKLDGKLYDLQSVLIGKCPAFY